MVEVRFADTLTNLRNGETRNGAEPWPLTSLRSNLNCLFATTQRILRKCSTSSGVRDSSSYIRTTTHAAIGPRCHITDSFDTMPSNSGETVQANPRFKEPQCQLHTHTSTTHTVETRLQLFVCNYVWVQNSTLNNSTWAPKKAKQKLKAKPADLRRGAIK